MNNEEVNHSQSYCKNCNLLTWVENQDDMLVCSSCGLVLSESPVLEHMEFIKDENSGRPNVKSSSSLCSDVKIAGVVDRFGCLNYDLIDPLNTYWNLLSRYARSLCFPENLVQLARRVIVQVTNNFQKTVFAKKWLILSSMYAVARDRDHPISLIDVSFACKVDHALLGKYYKKLLQIIPEFSVGLVDPTIYVYKTIGHLTGSSSDSNESSLHQVVEKANVLVMIATENFLVTGRKPESISGAAVYIAMSSVESLVNFAKIEEIALILKISSRTIQKRIRELEAVLLKISRDLPWGQKVDKKNIKNHLDFILVWYGRRKLDLARQKGLIEVAEGDGTLASKVELLSLPVAVSSSRCCASSSADKSKPMTIEKRFGLPNIKCPSILETIYGGAALEKRPRNRSMPIGSRQLIRCKTEIHMDSNPPCYASYLRERSKRQERIINAKKRICEIEHESDGKCQQESHKLQCTKPNQQSDYCKRLDSEDFAIQKLLLLGVPEDEILSTHPNRLLDDVLSRQPCTGANDLQYIRSDQEIELYDRMAQHKHNIDS